MSLFSLLSVGSSGLAVNQKGIEVTGNNVANVNTEGYSRQTLEVSATPTLQFQGQMVGTGSVVTGINRETNSFVTKQLTEKAGEYGGENAKSTILAEIEQIVSIDDGGISTSIDEFFDAWQELSLDPSSTLERQQVMQVGENLADSLQSMVADLQSVQENINTDLSGKITALNTSLEEVADLNIQIISAESTGVSANSLRDQRDVLIQEISEMAGVTYYEESNGMVSIQLSSGLPLVTADTVSTLTAAWQSGSMQLTLSSGSSTTALSGSDFGGEIGGMLDMRDDYIPELFEELDILAYNLATAVNTVHTSGVDLNGNSGNDFFSYISSGSNPWDGAASTLTMALTDTSAIAAGTTAAPDNEPGDNANVLNMVELQTTLTINGSSTFNDYYAKISSSVGLTVSQNSAALDSADDSLTQLQNMRDSVSGVSTDEEMLMLVQYQSGYEAAARYLTTVDELLDTLMTM